MNTAMFGWGTPYDYFCSFNNKWLPPVSSINAQSFFSARVTRSRAVAVAALKKRNITATDADTPAGNFPKDGHHSDWIKMEDKPKYYRSKYTAGPKDIKWLEELDRNYIKRVVKEASDSNNPRKLSDQELQDIEEMQEKVPAAKQFCQRQEQQKKPTIIEQSLRSSLESMADRFICPITQEIMTDPVIAADGFSYERTAIEQWIKVKGNAALSPCTGQPLAHTQVIPNITLKNAIQDYHSLIDQEQQKQGQQGKPFVKHHNEQFSHSYNKIAQLEEKTEQIQRDHAANVIKRAFKSVTLRNLVSKKHLGKEHEDLDRLLEDAQGKKTQAIKKLQQSTDNQLKHVTHETDQAMVMLKEEIVKVNNSDNEEELLSLVKQRIKLKKTQQEKAGGIKKVLQKKTSLISDKHDKIILDYKSQLVQVERKQSKKAAKLESGAEEVQKLNGVIQEQSNQFEHAIEKQKKHGEKLSHYLSEKPNQITFYKKPNNILNSRKENNNNNNNLK